MRKFSTLLITLFISFSGFGQTAKIDSLYKVFHSTKSDTAKINVLIEISADIIFQDADRYKEIADSVFTLAKKSKSTYHLGMANLVTGRYYFVTADNEKAIKYYRNAAKYFNKTGHKNKLLMAYGNIGSAYMNDNKNDSARYYLEKALNLSKEAKNMNGLFLNNYNLGVLYGRSDNKKESLNYIIAALKYAVQSKNKSYEASCYSIMGVTFMELREYAKAEQYTKSALNLFKEVNNDALAGNEYNNLGKLVSETKSDFHGAIKYYKEAIKYHKKTSNNYSLTTSLANIGRNFIQLEEYDSAYYYLNQSLDMADSIGYDEEKIRIYQNLAEIALNKNKLSEAKAFGLKSLEIAKSNDFLEDTSDALYLLAEIYAKAGDFRNAHYSYIEANELKDSISSVEKVATALELETRYQTEKKEKQIAEQQLQLAKENRNKWLLTSGLGGLLAVLVIVGFYYRRNQKQKKQIVNLQKELHHRMKNNLSIIDTFIEVLKNEFPGGKAQLKLTELQNRIISINEVHRQLYKNKNITELNLKKYIETLAENLSHSFDRPEIQVKTEIPESTVLSAERSFSVGLIANEFLTNSYKYAFDGDEPGRINITLNEKENDYIMRFSDNGKGFPADFDIGNTDSFGLRIIRLLSGQLNGHFAISSNNGVSMEIRFPKK